MAKNKKKQIRKDLVKLDGGTFRLRIISAERAWKAQSLGRKAEMVIPEEATDVTHPFCFKHKVSMVREETCIITVSCGSTGRVNLVTVLRGKTECRPLVWTGRGLRLMPRLVNPMTGARKVDERPQLTHEQLCDVASALMSVPDRAWGAQGAQGAQGSQGAGGGAA